MTDDDAGTSPAGEGRRSSLPERTAPSRGEAWRRDVPGRRAAVLGAVLAGVAGGVFGTLLHGHLLAVGGAQLPVGVVGSLLLAGSLFLYCGLWARSIILTALAGAVAYGVVALLSSSSKTLILTGSSEAAPAVALAGNVWLFGVLVVTLAAVAIGAVVLRPQRTKA